VDDSGLFLGVGAGDAQNEVRVSAGQIAGGVVGSLAAALAIAAGLVFLLILRRKDNPSCHEEGVEAPNADEFEEFSEVLSEVNESFDEGMEESVLLSRGGK
jgi:hypothetical protein